MDAVQQDNLMLQRCIQEINRTANDQPASDTLSGEEIALRQELAKLTREINETPERVRMRSWVIYFRVPECSQRLLVFKKRSKLHRLPPCVNILFAILTVCRVVSWCQGVLAFFGHGMAKKLFVAPEATVSIFPVAELLENICLTTPYLASSAGQRRHRVAALRRPVAEGALQDVVADTLVAASDRCVPGIPRLVGRCRVGRRSNLFYQERLHCFVSRIDLDRSRINEVLEMDRH